MLSGNSLRQTVHTHCASVHQAAKLVAALVRVVGVTAGWRKVMTAYRRVYDSFHLQGDCQELGSAPEWYGMVNVDLYSAIITKVSNALIDYAMGVNPTHGNRVWATFTF